MFSFLIDQNINEPFFKKSDKNLRQQEGACKDVDIVLWKKKTDTTQRMIAATENKEENSNCKLICSKDQANVDKKVDNEKTNERETLRDTASSNEVNDEGLLGSNVRH